MEPQKIQNSQSNPDTNEQFRNITLPDFQLYYNDIIIKIV